MRVAEALAHLEAADHAVAAAIERLGEAQERREHCDRAARRLVEILEAVVPALRRRAAVIAGHAAR